MVLKFISIENVSLRVKRKENEKNTVFQDGQGCCGVLRWISFILNSLILWTSKRDNFYFFNANIFNLILLFSSQSLKHDTLVFSKTYKGRYARFFNAGEIWNNVINLWKKRNNNDFVWFKRQTFISSITITNLIIK